MPSRPASTPRRRSILDRSARIVFAFVVMNAAAVAGLVAALLGTKVWNR